MCLQDDGYKRKGNGAQFEPEAAYSGRETRGPGRERGWRGHGPAKRSNDGNTPGGRGVGTFSGGSGGLTLRGEVCVANPAIENEPARTMRVPCSSGGHVLCTRRMLGRTKRDPVSGPLCYPVTEFGTCSDCGRVLITVVFENVDTQGRVDLLRDPAPE